MGPVGLADHTPYVFSAIIIKRDTRITFLEPHAGPLHFILVHDDKTVALIVSTYPHNLFPILI